MEIEDKADDAPVEAERDEIADLEPSGDDAESVKGGVSNVLKTRHDTVKNSIGN